MIKPIALILDLTNLHCINTFLYVLCCHGRYQSVNSKLLYDISDHNIQ